MVNLLENCLELAEVPGYTLIEKRIRLVSTIDRCLVPQRLPILRLNLYVGALKGLTITLSPLEVLEELARLSYVFKLVVSILTIYILLYGCCHTKISELDQTVNAENDLTYHLSLFRNCRRALFVLPSHRVL